MTIPIRSICVLVLALMPHIALAQENATDNVTKGAAHPERIMPDQATLDACDKVYSDRKLDPLRGKMPTDGLGVWTDEMSKNDLKPNAEEKSALRAYLQAEIACQKLISAYIFENDEIYRQPADKDAEALFTKRINPLKSGKITYAEYFRRIDQAGKEWLAKYQKENGIDPQRYEHAIELRLAPFKPNYAANSPWWGFYSDAIATAKDVDSGKISEETAQKLIDERRLKFNQELAVASGQNTAAPNDWYKVAVDWYKATIGSCGTDSECVRILTSYRNHAESCYKGDQQACIDFERDRKDWSLRGSVAATATPTAPKDAMMECLQGVLHRAIEHCKQTDCPKGTILGTVRLRQQAECGYSAIEPEQQIIPVFPQLPAYPPPQPRGANVQTEVCGYKSDGQYHCGTDCGYKSDGQYHCGSNCGYKSDGQYHCE